MRLSTRGRFAVTAMIDLALRESANPVPLQDIAVRHRISLSYLEQVFAKLRQHGLVESTRGPGGGYALARQSDSISVADIVCAIDDKEDGRSLAAQRSGPLSPEQMTQDLCAALESTVVAYMETISLRHLAAQQRSKGVPLPEKKVVKKGVFERLKRETVPRGVANSVFALAHV